VRLQPKGQLVSLLGVGHPALEVGPVKARLVDLASLLHDLVEAENIAKDLAVRQATEAVATSKYLSDSKSARPATKKVIPNTGDCSDRQTYLGIGGLTVEKVTF